MYRTRAWAGGGWAAPVRHRASGPTQARLALLCAVLALGTLLPPAVAQPSQLAVLQGLKAALSDPQQQLSTWTGNDYCTWSRVACSSSDVTSLDLSFATLSGPLPDDLQYLTALRELYAQGQSINGTLPSAWSAWGTSLQVLDLSRNALTGTLPSAWSTWTSATTVSLQRNQLSGTLPTPWQAWAAMSTLSLQSNRLSGTVPEAWSTGSPSMASLTRLSLTNNTLMCGPIPTNWASKVVATNTSLGAACPSPPPPPPTVASYLLSLKAAVSYDPEGFFASWTPATEASACSSWLGVSCLGGDITELQLTDASLQVRAGAGTSPDEGSQLVT